MSASDDRPDEMFGDDELDTDFDMLLDGVAIDPRLVPLTRIVDDVHIVAGVLPPRRPSSSRPSSGATWSLTRTCHPAQRAPRGPLGGARLPPRDLRPGSGLWRGSRAASVR